LISAIRKGLVLRSFLAGLQDLLGGGADWDAQRRVGPLDGVGHRGGDVFGGHGPELAADDAEGFGQRGVGVALPQEHPGPLGATGGDRAGLDEAHLDAEVAGLDGQGLGQRLQRPLAGAVRAELTSRLKSLVRDGVLARDDDGAGVVGYRLTAKGTALWPIVQAAMTWGDTYCSPAGARRVLRHDQDEGLLGPDGRCQDCGLTVPVPDIRIEPGPGYQPADADGDPWAGASSTPRRLLEPITATGR
jgi:hypothetical protein